MAAKKTPVAPVAEEPKDIFVGADAGVGVLATEEVEPVVVAEVVVDLAPAAADTIEQPVPAAVAEVPGVKTYECEMTKVQLLQELHIVRSHLRSMAFAHIKGMAIPGDTHAYLATMVD